MHTDSEAKEAEKAQMQEEEKRKLEEIRRQIDKIDDEIAKLLFKRIELAIYAREAKKRLEKPISDAEREREVIRKWRKRAENLSMCVEMKVNERIKDICEEMFMRIGSEIVKYTLRIEEEWDMEEKKD
ncbi:MAG: chorismate mutase [Candidatus Methanospirare jalkutatii]|nr:chorismate mutase [Candidatus Methanospirare jalkutatii]